MPHISIPCRRGQQDRPVIGTQGRYLNAALPRKGFKHRQVVFISQQIDRVRADPRSFNSIAEAGYRRVVAEHTWMKRVMRLLALLEGCPVAGNQGSI